MAQKPSKKPKIEPAIAVPIVQEAWWQKILHEPLALGLIPLIVLRPWIDGITYPSDNYYFVWGIVLLFVLMGVRSLMRGDSLRFPVPTLLLTLFWLLGASTLFTTIQFHATYKTFLFWSGHFFLFLLVLNGLRTRTAISIVLATCGVTFFAESLWGLIHYQYVLPHVRDSILQNPGLLKQHFGTITPSPELVHRLQVNRAFGSLLFPNALAAFLVLGIPFVFASIIQTIRDYLADNATEPQNNAAPAMEPMVYLLIGGLTLLFSSAISYFVVWMVGSFASPVPPEAEQWGPFILTSTGWQLHTAGFVLSFLFFVVLVPAVLSIGAGVIAAKRGMAAVGLMTRLVSLPLLLLMQLIALWLTYSRGGLMALFAAIILSSVLIYWPRLMKQRQKTPALNRAAAVMVLLIALVTGLAMAQQAPPASPQPIPAAAPTPAAPAAVPLAPAPAASPLADSGITSEGQDLTMKDLANPASFWLRLTYWKVGLRMAMDNFILGVGLGNFGTAYPIYQYVGAGDVKAAHNDYLQALCETGILGLILFCAFWGYFAWWGAKRIMQEQDKKERLILAGVYTGILAFLIHSLVDFNFFNPSLAFFAILFAGIFYAQSTVGKTAPISKKSKYAIAPLLAGASMVAAMTLCIFLSDFYIGNRSWLNLGNNQLMTTLFDAGDFFSKDIAPQQNQPNRPTAINIMMAVQLVPDRKVLESIGSIHVRAPEAPARHRALRPNEPVTPDAFLLVTDKAKAWETVRPYVDNWLENLEAIDSTFPYSPDLAAYFVQYYENLAINSVDPKLKQNYVLKMFNWAGEGVKRSPKQSDFHQWLARALWFRGNIDTTSESRRDYFNKGIDEYKLAAELYPISVNGWRRYGDAMKKYGEALISSGDKVHGDTYLSEAQKILDRAKKLEQGSV